MFGGFVGNAEGILTLCKAALQMCAWVQAPAHKLIGSFPGCVCGWCPHLLVTSVALLHCWCVLRAAHCREGRVAVHAAGWGMTCPVGQRLFVRLRGTLQVAMPHPVR